MDRKGSHGESKGSQREPKGSRNEPKGASKGCFGRALVGSVRPSGTKSKNTRKDPLFDKQTGRLFGTILTPILRFFRNGQKA